MLLQKSCLVLFSCCFKFIAVHNVLLEIAPKNPAVPIMVHGRCIILFSTSGCHLPAFFRAAAAEFGTFLTMLVLVLAAFFGAGFAGFCAQLADGLCVRATQAH